MHSSGLSNKTYHQLMVVRAAYGGYVHIQRFRRRWCVFVWDRWAWRNIAVSTTPQGALANAYLRRETSERYYSA